MIIEQLASNCLNLCNRLLLAPSCKLQRGHQAACFWRHVQLGDRKDLSGDRGRPARDQCQGLRLPEAEGLVPEANVALELARNVDTHLLATYQHTVDWTKSEDPIMHLCQYVIEGNFRPGGSWFAFGLGIPVGS